MCLLCQLENLQTLHTIDRGNQAEVLSSNNEIRVGVLKCKISLSGIDYIGGQDGKVKARTPIQQY